MINFFKNFSKDESGAVTVDWVVLTAAVVGLAVAAYSSIQSGATSLTASTETFMGQQAPGAVGGGTEEE
jgi:Flp pilus assembly pilin Flp